MKWTWGLALMVMLAGCTQGGTDNPEADLDGGPDGGNETAEPQADPVGQGNATSSPGNATTASGNMTEGPPQNGTAENATQNVTRPETVVVEETFSGTLPLDGDVEGHHGFSVPANATRVQMVYTSEFVGLFNAVARATDSTDTIRMDSLDACGATLGPPSGTMTCEMEVAEDILPGDWTASVYWQLGQATESYTLDVTVWAGG